MLPNGQPQPERSPIEPPAAPTTEPAPAPLFNAPQPTIPANADVVYFAEVAAGGSGKETTGADLQWLTIDEIARTKPAPTAAAPTPVTEPVAAVGAPPAPAADVAPSEPVAAPKTPVNPFVIPDTPADVIVADTPADVAAPAPSPAVEADVTVEPIEEPAPAAATAPIAEPAVAGEPAPAPQPAPAVQEADQLPPNPAPHVNAAGAATQIAELLRAAHDTAARLRSHAEVEVKRTVEAARAEVQAHKQNQMRVLDAEQAAAEQLNAEIIHNARLAATEVRNRAEEEAAEITAAAKAVLAQAAAHAHAAKALVAHNLAEIEAAKHETAARGAELIGVGKHMVATVEGLDDSLSDRLVHTDQLIEWAQAQATPLAS